MLYQCNVSLCHGLFCQCCALLCHVSQYHVSVMFCVSCLTVSCYVSLMFECVMLYQCHVLLCCVMSVSCFNMSCYISVMFHCVMVCFVSVVLCCVMFHCIVSVACFVCVMFNCVMLCQSNV